MSRQAIVDEGFKWLGQLHYSQSNRYDFRNGGHADCSSFYQHCVKVGSGVNPGDWTGEQLGRGRRVDSPQKGDAVFYGVGGNMQHVAMYVGDGMVLSHGGPADGPVHVPMDYRKDISQFRSYLDDEEDEDEMLINEYREKTRITNTCCVFKYVNVDELSIRMYADVNAPTARWSHLNKGNPVLVTGFSPDGKWSKIQFDYGEDGGEGWVWSDYLS